ncbi:hypothetical protein GCM10010277_85800 [Streptomyces longisporoflavus]|nr:hypothetical protein GCM10010277_85800 [Streptomyces longisporoflavus]
MLFEVFEYGGGEGDVEGEVGDGGVDLGHGPQVGRPVGHRAATGAGEDEQDAEERGIPALPTAGLVPVYRYHQRGMGRPRGGAHPSPDMSTISPSCSTHGTWCPGPC